MDLVETLSFLFQLNFLTLGKVIFILFSLRGCGRFLKTLKNAIYNLFKASSSVWFVILKRTPYKDNILH